MYEFIVACADIGSVRNRGGRPKFGWWSAEEGKCGHWPSELVEHVNDLLSQGRKVALGFECPLFVPLPKCDRDLGRRRHMEGNRAWSASAGSHVLTTGLVQVAWMLGRIREKHPCKVYLSWREFCAAERGLLLWGAFVAGPGKRPRPDPEPHIADAKAGAQAFIKETAMGSPCTVDPEEDGSFYSLVGAAMLLTGCTTDTSVLHRSCVVVKVNSTNLAPVESSASGNGDRKRPAGLT